MWTFFVFCYYPTNVKLLLLAVACGLPIPPLPLGVRSGQVYNRSHHVWRRRNAKRRARFFWWKDIVLNSCRIYCLNTKWTRSVAAAAAFLTLGSYWTVTFMVLLSGAGAICSSTFWLTWPSITRILDGQTNTSSSKVGDILMQMQEESYMFGLKASIRRR